MASEPERWDIFCRVVDNLGDVGVSWRLARQLAREHGKRVRLWLDDLTVLAKLRPEVDPAYDIHTLDGVEVRRLRKDFEVTDGIADVVVETFGCDPPEAYIERMAQASPRPRWINLEYLSAEEWIEGSHALPSPNPRLPLVKHYFFPGFTARTGGLLREGDLLERRDTFQQDPGAQAAFWKSVVGRAPPEGALKVSLFGYAGAPYDSLVRSSLQERRTAENIRRNSRDGGARREIEIFTVPFLAQDRYDQLLWACDVNFVRGEDSFVRAQWAARPFVWHIYPTDDGSHWIKMAAFLTRYTAALEREQAAAVTSLWEAWNRRDNSAVASVAPGLGEAWPAFTARRPALEAHAREWARELATRRGLVEELVDFADNVLK
jgi:uncharacterized repeat protein (TIGR03837 family)